MWNKYIISCIISIFLLVSAVTYLILLNNLQLVPIISLFSALIGIFVTGTINLIFEDNRFKNNRDKLISSIRAKNAINRSIGKIITYTLEKEIKYIDSGIIVEINNINTITAGNYLLSLPLNDLEPLEEVMEDVKLLMDEESKLLPIIASEVNFINKIFKLREDFILKGISLEIIRYYDESILINLKKLDENIKKYEKDIFKKDLKEISIDEFITAKIKDNKDE